MELMSNGTRSSQTEIPDRNFPKLFVNGKGPENLSEMGENFRFAVTVEFSCLYKVLD